MLYTEKCALSQEKLSGWNGEEGLRNAIRFVKGPVQHDGDDSDIQENKMAVEMGGAASKVGSQNTVPLPPVQTIKLLYWLRLR